MVLKCLFLSALEGKICLQQDRGLYSQERLPPIEVHLWLLYSLAVIEPKNLWAADTSTVSRSQDLSQSSVSSLKPYGDGSAKSRESVTSN